MSGGKFQVIEGFLSIDHIIELFHGCHTFSDVWHKLIALNPAEKIGLLFFLAVVAGGLIEGTRALIKGWRKRRHNKKTIPPPTMPASPRPHTPRKRRGKPMKPRGTSGTARSPTQNGAGFSDNPNTGISNSGK